MIKIGPVKLETNVLLAPLSGCADLSFRLIAREHGAKFCFYEMADANSLVHAPRASKNSDMLQGHEDDRPIAAQIVGAEADMMLRAARRLVELTDPLFLDVNAACPVKKVIKKRAGAHLITDPKRLSDILKTLSSSLKIPVTVKLRTGYDKADLKHAASIAKTCEASGAAALFVHGRTRTQGYSGSIDYGSIKAMKESVKIPVFGSGNIINPESAKKMFDETSCDGVLVARGSFGNPWIFGDIENYLKRGEAPAEKGAGMRKKALLKHISYIEKYKKLKADGKIGVMRKVAMWYTKGFSNAARLRDRLCRTKNCEELLKLVEAL